MSQKKNVYLIPTEGNSDYVLLRLVSLLAQNPRKARKREKAARKAQRKKK